MKTKLFFYFIAFLCFLTPAKTFASHAAGVELRYEHLAGNDYRFYFTLYRDCSGIATNSSYTILGSSICGDYITITVNADSAVNVSQICEGDSDKCVNPASLYMGVEAWYYHGDVTLPALCSLWTFGIYPSICNRNSAITNITPNGSTYCTYIEAKLNNVDFPFNSSPVFSALPLFHLCNQTQYLHLYAIDPDGDSLAFEMYPPHSDSIMNVQYINGLSATQPVTYAFPGDSTMFDTLTGDLRFKADVPQITIVAVRVNEFRNGLFVGSEERDIEVIFSNCTSNAPTATGMNGTSLYTSHICADSIITFQVFTNDVDGDSVRTFWQNNVPGSSVNLSGVNNQIVSFSWQPSASDISSAPYTFILYVTDSTCPYVYYNSYQYQIYVDSCFAFTNVNDPEGIISFLAYYSPNDQKIIYRYQSKVDAGGDVALIDMQGRILQLEHLSNSKMGNRTVDASILSPGMYMIGIKTRFGVFRSQKIIVY